MDFNEYRPDQSFEEPEEHADERWLVSYADMMTLLFGLFVLLFSMSKMSSSEIEKIKQGASEQFGSNRVLDPNAINLSKEELLNRLESQETELIGLRGSAEAQATRIESLEGENAELRNSIEEIQSELKETATAPLVTAPVEKPAAAPDAALTAEIAELKKQLHLVNLRNLRLEKNLKEASTSDTPEELQDQVKELESQLASRNSASENAEAKIVKYKVFIKKLNDSRKSLKNKTLALSNDLQDAKDQLSFALRELADAKAAAAQVKSLERKLASAEEASKVAEQTSKELSAARDAQSSSSAALKGLNEKLKLSLESEARLKAEAQNLAKVNTELKERIRLDEIQRAGDLEKRSFMAFMINWSSKDHDIDLVIEDPKGQRFDFKKRTIAGQPGKFALDTRRGPGAEIWQTDQLIPGRYKATYSFFNQYGNVAPAQVLATIFTPKGSVELKPVDLDLTSKRTHEVIFEISRDGQLKIMKN